MLNNIINSYISHNNNEINKLHFLNKQKKNKEKYEIVNLKKKNLFNKSGNIILNRNLNLQFDETNISINANKKINDSIKKINNVYKNNFKNAPTTGFGDFVRGCYFLMEFCEPLNLIVDFHIYDSNIKHYLKYFSLKPIISKNIANNIYKFEQINCSFTNNNGIISYNFNNNNDDFVNYLNSQPIYLNNVFINTVNFPSHFVSQKHINCMKTILEPTDIFKIEINNLMNKLGLVKNDYITYHIRLGDNYIENQFELIQNNKLQQIINKLDLDNDNNFLLISDSVLIKNKLSKKYVKIKTIETEAIHTCQANDIDKIKYTLFDFYLMSTSKKIISFSIYPHGSGFSKWCATTYEIPYVCYQLL